MKRSLSKLPNESYCEEHKIRLSFQFRRTVAHGVSCSTPISKEWRRALLRRSTPHSTTTAPRRRPPLRGDRSIGPVACRTNGLCPGMDTPKGTVRQNHVECMLLDYSP